MEKSGLVRHEDVDVVENPEDEFVAGDFVTEDAVVVEP